MTNEGRLKKGTLHIQSRMTAKRYVPGVLLLPSERTQSFQAGMDTVSKAVCIFFHPDYTVGSGVTPNHASTAAARALFRLAGFTAGGEFHPALKIFDYKNYK